MTDIAETIAVDYRMPTLARKTLVTNDGLCRVFRITLLLTGRATQAETAIVDALRSIDLADASDQSLFCAAVRYAVTPAPAKLRECRDIDYASWILPDGLQAVLRLSTGHRHCFVLRILAGLSRGECSNLLQLDPRTVDEYTGAAVLELATVTSNGC